MRVFTLLLISAAALRASEPVFTAEQVAFYEQDVKPLLAKHCFRCHGAEEKKIKAELNLTNRAAILAGGDSGPAVKLDKPAESLLLLAINQKRPGDADVMPPSGKLTDAEIAVLTKWVEQKLPVNRADLGKAHETKGGVISEASRKYWAYQPVRKPEAKSIDELLNAKLAEKKLMANGPADKSVLVRRLCYDLIGLPPTPEQVAAYLQDESPNAYENLVDELLKSPHYGERWGRHWLDVVRYAETNGYERDGPKPFAWKYRDYVIRSLNADKPYDQFLREQLAGDELPWSVDALTATGFYRLGLWDDEPADQQQALFDGFDDLVTTVGQGMLGMSLNCARCHDHKRDPITHADYYRFVAFFREIRLYSDTRSAVSQNNIVDVTPPEKKKLYEADLAERHRKIEALRAAMKPIEDAAILKMSPQDQLAVQDGKRDEVLRKLPSVLEGEAKANYSKLQKELRELENQPLPSQEFAMGLNKCNPNPPPVYVLARGNPHAPKEKELCPPGFPSVLNLADPVITPRAKTAGRRIALADWISSKSNPLTARVFVNRLWQHHFGRGLVGSPNDFGKLGELPTHPELLDWLAADFMDNGWRIKRMHKLIVMSDAYRRSSAGNEKNLTIDPANQFLWRFNSRRLSAEEVRDTMLLVAGKLNLELYGPSVYPKIPDDVLAGQSRPGEGWLLKKGGGYDPKKPDAGNRRTIYVHVKRSLQVPILAHHDQADTDSSCPVRYTTTVPTQALGLLNGEFSFEIAKALASRLKTVGDQLEESVAKGIRLTTGRDPKPDEVAKDVAFIQKLVQEHGLSAVTALERYCLLLLNANEFVYLD